MLPNDPALTETQNYVLWTVAQFKYGWRYVQGVGFRSAARALERRGLISLDDEYRATLSSTGEQEVIKRWPNSPAALQSYVPPAGGWDMP